MVGIYSQSSGFHLNLKVADWLNLNEKTKHGATVNFISFRKKTIRRPSTRSIINLIQLFFYHFRAYILGLV